jgi:thiamine biosynthesis protein ThiS
MFKRRFIEMNLIVNGKEKQMADDSTVLQLVEALELNPQQVAVEVNREIVKKEQFDATVLNDGDEVEVVHFVGGGLE